MPFIFPRNPLFSLSQFISPLMHFFALSTICTVFSLFPFGFSSLALVPFSSPRPPPPPLPLSLISPFHILFSPSCILFSPLALPAPFISTLKLFIFLLSFCAVQFSTVILYFPPSHFISPLNLAFSSLAFVPFNYLRNPLFSPFTFNFPPHAFYFPLSTPCTFYFLP